MTRNGALEDLQTILDSVGDEILKASDEDIGTVFEELDLDSDAGAKRLENVIRSSMASFRLSNLKTARAGYDSAITKKTSSSKIPADANKQREMLNNVSSRTKDNNKDFTLEFREGDINSLSEKDLQSTLEDLEELGALEEEA